MEFEASDFDVFDVVTDKFEELAEKIGKEVLQHNSDVGFDQYSVEVGAFTVIEKILNKNSEILDVLGIGSINSKQITAAAKALAARDGYSFADADPAIIRKYTKDAKVALEAANAI